MGAPHEHDTANPERFQAGPGPRPRILLADDDAEMRTLLAFTLRSEGYEVVECADGTQLLEHLTLASAPHPPQRVDLVITDMRMPGLSGLEVLRRVREQRGMPPIILITAFGDEQTHIQARQLGAAASIDKPFEIPCFLERVHALMTTPPPPGNTRDDTSDPL